MPLILKNFANDSYKSGIWKVTESEDELLKIYNPNEYDIEILNNTLSNKRKIEILAVRTLIKQLGLNISITYNVNRKPISNKGYISISHSFDHVCVIWHPKEEPAIDIEKINPRIQKIAKRAFSEKELNFAQNNEKILTILWNCKECVFKISNKTNIEFKTQIEVLPFSHDCNTIYCNLIYSNRIINYKFYQFEINDYSCVWGGKA
jgi:phosphopantetheinyl transferase